MPPSGSSSLEIKNQLGGTNQIKYALHDGTNVLTTIGASLVSTNYLGDGESETIKIPSIEGPKNLLLIPSNKGASLQASLQAGLHLLVQLPDASGQYVPAYWKGLTFGPGETHKIYHVNNSCGYYPCINSAVIKISSSKGMPPNGWANLEIKNQSGVAGQVKYSLYKISYSSVKESQIEDLLVATNYLADGESETIEVPGTLTCTNLLLKNSENSKTMWVRVPCKSNTIGIQGYKPICLTEDGDLVFEQEAASNYKKMKGCF